MSDPGNKSVTEMVKEMSAREEGIRDAQSLRNYWMSRRTEEPMQDEGDMLVPRRSYWKEAAIVLGLVVAVYVGLVVALVLSGV